jgi:translation elongation factor EF-Tu-like GTPase
LTGIDTDRLKEEKERGITIDIGFANLRLDERTVIGFIDVPGHERFVKNMLAGVGGIDAVMLVVAADESIMPQTREHLDICSLLQIKRGLTVLTKIDATDPDLVDLVEIEVHEFLKGSFREGAPVIRVSSVTSEGIPQLVTVLQRIAREVPGKDDSQIFRLPIDRAFTMKGFGTVVAGTLIAGRVHTDDEVETVDPRPRQSGIDLRIVRSHLERQVELIILEQSGTREVAVHEHRRRAIGHMHGRRAQERRTQSHRGHPSGVVVGAGGEASRGRRRMDCAPRRQPWKDDPARDRPPEES